MTLDFCAADLEGGRSALRYAFRDLQTAEQAVAVTLGREVCVQAGGCLGVFPKYLSRIFETVYTFEPSPDLFPVMVRNAPEKNVVRFQAALGSTPGPVTAVQARRDGDRDREWHEGVTHVVPGGPIPTMRIDDLGLSSCNLIYLDVEGFELYALQGAADTVGRFRPTVVVEVNGSGETLGILDEDVRTWLRVHGYELRVSSKSDEIWTPRY